MTISNTASFFNSQIQLLLREGHQVDIAASKKRQLDEEIRHQVAFYDISFDRNPFSKNNMEAYRQMKKLLRDNTYDMIHTHTPVASVITRLAAKNSLSKIFYTAHGFHFYKGAPLKNWLIYYPIEKYLSRFTDCLITINKEDYQCAKNKFQSKEILYVPGVGIDVEKIRRIEVSRTQKRKELEIPENAYLIHAVGELNDNKNHGEIIHAISELPDVYCVISGVGEKKDDLQRLIDEKKCKDRVRLLGYREDVFEINKVADLFISASKREGLPVSVMEAMACGLPIVASSIRGTNDLIEHGVNGFLVSEQDTYQEAIQKLKDQKNLSDAMSQANLKRAEKYDYPKINQRMMELYQEKCSKSL